MSSDCRRPTCCITHISSGMVRWSKLRQITENRSGIRNTKGCRKSNSELNTVQGSGLRGGGGEEAAHHRQKAVG